MEVFVRSSGAPRGREDKPYRSAREGVGRPPRGSRFEIRPPARGEGKKSFLGARAVAVVKGLSRSQEIDRLIFLFFVLDF